MNVGWNLACTGTFVQLSDFVETDGRPSLQREIQFLFDRFCCAYLQPEENCIC